MRGRGGEQSRFEGGGIPFFLVETSAKGDAGATGAVSPKGKKGDTGATGVVVPQRPGGLNCHACESEMIITGCIYKCAR